MKVYNNVGFRLRSPWKSTVILDFNSLLRVWSSWKCTIMLELIVFMTVYSKVQRRPRAPTLPCSSDPGIFGTCGQAGTHIFYRNPGTRKAKNIGTLILSSRGETWNIFTRHPNGGWGDPILVIFHSIRPQGRGGGFCWWRGREADLLSPHDHPFLSKHPFCQIAVFLIILYF